jgi:hypothetical protein
MRTILKNINLRFAHIIVTANIGFLI